MRTLIFVALLGAALSMNAEINLWKQFTSEFDKDYKRDEELYRFALFRDTLKEITQLNLENPHATFGLTKFSDLSNEEFIAKYTGFKKPASATAETNYAPKLSGRRASEVDHEASGHVQKVKDQGACGSCWAFSAVGSVESALAVNGQELLHLSDQQLVDCDTANSGCNGGLMVPAYQYIERVGGLMSTQDYPYTARRSACKFDESKIAASISGHQVISDSFYTPANEEELLQHLARQPIAVAIDANALRTYRGGIISKGTTRLNHAVLATGYGSENGTEYIRLKNSWGNHGEKGYFRILKGNNTLGVTQYTCYPEA